MDIGGSICYRCGQRLQTDRKVDYQVKAHFHYFRPYYDDFMKAIIEHPRVKFAVYTSIMRKNVMPLLMNIFNQTKLKHLKNQVFEVFDQEYNAKDAQGPEVWSTKRDLNKVWGKDRVKDLGIGPKNTLMIDSEPFKVRDFLANTFLLEPYTVEEVL